MGERGVLKHIIIRLSRVQMILQYFIWFVTKVVVLMQLFHWHLATKRFKFFMFYNACAIIITIPVLCCFADHCVAEPGSVWGWWLSAGRLRDTPWLSHRHWCLQLPPDRKQVRSSSEVNTLIKLCVFVFYFVIAGNRHSCGFAEAACFSLLQGFQCKTLSLFSNCSEYCIPIVGTCLQLVLTMGESHSIPGNVLLINQADGFS